ncbi:uncharacterized transposon-derived protein F54H12.3 [Trichonephila clavata]|uniref:Uncharacterized transposon-derived protein F54H12.3 n=1 Tax=Trichonephila clavata TaxID=2740835 RepID=A0A8X6LJ62_TRICU|nr:uncharacterized transposon-derived protein F54H12.3 [Trichonephila clavata]
MKQDTYTLFKPTRFKFSRRKTLSYGIGDLIQSDLVDLSKFCRQNKGVKFLLTAIDVFSKKAHVLTLKNKNSGEVLGAFKKLLKRVKPIVHLQTDEGKEFYNKPVQDLFKKHNIHHYSSHSEHKASVVERFNRTLKNKLFHIFTHRGSYKYIDVPEKIIKSYNDSVHRTTGFAPNKVTPELESHIFKKVYGYNVDISYKFNVDDQVRISKAKKTFRRGYLPNWSDEVFEIDKRFASNPPTYVLKDLKGETLKGRFYESELQKVNKSSSDTFWSVEKILRTKGKGENKEFFVREVERFR